MIVVTNVICSDCPSSNLRQNFLIKHHCITRMWYPHDAVTDSPLTHQRGENRNTITVQLLTIILLAFSYCVGHSYRHHLNATMHYKYLCWSFFDDSTHNHLGLRHNSESTSYWKKTKKHAWITLFALNNQKRDSVTCSENIWFELCVTWSNFNSADNTRAPLHILHRSDMDGRRAIYRRTVVSDLIAI